jgi:hypothetical protein
MMRTQIQPVEEHARKIKVVARGEDPSMAAAMRRAVDQGLERRFKLTRLEGWERPVNAVGRFHGGMAHPAANHDTYLAPGYANEQAACVFLSISR